METKREKKENNNEPIDMSELMQLDSDDELELKKTNEHNKNKNNNDDQNKEDKETNTSTSTTKASDQDQKKEINIPKIGNPFPHADTTGRIEELLKNLPVRLESSPTLGRYFVARRDIPAGSAVMECEPYIWAVDPPLKVRSCDHCLKQSKVRMIHFCNECKFIFWCSKECENESKKKQEHHAVECRFLKKFPKWGKEDAWNIRIVLRLLCKRYFGVSVDKSMDPADVDLLCCNFDDLSYLFKKDYYEIATKMAVHLKPMLPQGVDISSTRLIDLLAKSHCNAFGMWLPSDVCIATGVFPAASFLNHSCLPNCARTYEGRKLVVRCLYDIKEGDPVTISYICPEQPLEKRKEDLKIDYTFDCLCIRCNAPPEKRDKMDSFILQFICPNQSCLAGFLAPVSTGSNVYRCRLCQKKQCFDLIPLSEYGNNNNNNETNKTNKEETTSTST